MKFNYYAKKITGEEKKGVIEAKDRFDLAHALRKKGYSLVSLKEIGGVNFLSRFSSIGSVSVSDKMMFTKNLSVMIKAGLSISRALDILVKQTKNKKFMRVISRLMEKTREGDPLSLAMKGYPKVFSKLLVSMVKVGEETGKLSESLEVAGFQLERDHLLMKRIKGAMMYPSIIIIAMLLIGVFMFIYVVPTLVSTFSELNVELPLSTKIIIAISNILSNHFLAAILVFAVAILLAIWATGTEKGKGFLSAAFLRLPLVSPIVKKINSARTSRTLASLIGSGVNVLDALSITRDVLQNHRYKKVLETAGRNVQKGAPMSDAFKEAEDLYPALIGEMMSVGEETGKTSQMLDQLAAFYEAEVADATKDLTTIIEPILMLFIGAAVGFFALSMIRPMYSMLNGI
ncbi:TPA: hypothetical protein DEW47_01705 [Patescibacteria group bacterium]|nr:MAG: Type II secretion system protein [Parcubacteria group bacterium GW2011_GWF2_40_10]KKR47447.1 MAG: Type II secretion system protein [Parcubacteria group bacterium GW2011_GWA2_40_143]KKR59868.1 MAG: Type II secretion system protein [Parcubacteria group bacterium GW2011_GWC2_40_31]KKR74939.1 MAG: Type II secretion system protein [Parcubacteria group bacterium GW2011_GWB2_40_8]KKR81875.1 MAG: Type II secretion system protein [Parcubacteria group bacterium GW2011_GWD2_40_9]HBB56603.1 hypoth